MAILVEHSFAFVHLENGKTDGKHIRHCFSLQISFDTLPIPTHTSLVTLEMSPDTHTVVIYRCDVLYTGVYMYTYRKFYVHRRTVIYA